MPERNIAKMSTNKLWDLIYSDDADEEAKDEATEEIEMRGQRWNGEGV